MPSSDHPFVSVEQAREHIAQAHERIYAETGSPIAKRMAEETRAGLHPVYCSLMGTYVRSDGVVAATKR